MDKTEKVFVNILYIGLANPCDNKGLSIFLQLSIEYILYLILHSVLVCTGYNITYATGAYSGLVGICGEDISPFHEEDSCRRGMCRRSGMRAWHAAVV